MTRPENSVQLYTFREQLKNDFDQTLTRLAAMGFQSVEPFELPTNIDKLKAALANAGLKAPTAHGSVVTDPRGAIEAAVELGSSVLIDPYQPEEIFQSESKLQQLADQLSAAAELGREHGVRIGYHNHDHDIRNEVRGLPALVALAQMVSNDVVFEIDLFWCQVANVDAIELLDALDGRVVALHAKDAPLGGHVQDQVVLGEGSVKLLECIRHLPDAQVVVEFDDYAGDIFEGVSQSLDYLKLNGVG
jgi:sugar phosphate isomerase/epimerase